MNIRVEQPCPQCGGAVTVSAEDRLLTCPYCRVKNFFLANGPFRYSLPPWKAEQGEPLVYAPYLRFKGNIFSVTDSGISHRVVDTTQDGSALSSVLPASLGVRPQAMSLVRIHSGTKGRFLPLAIEFEKILEKAIRLHAALERSDHGTHYHRAYIGEALSFIYLPLARRQDRLFDAVLGQPLPISSVKLLSAALTGSPFQPHWQMRFKAALCPRCGRSLDGEADCLALTCGSCNLAWQIGEAGLEQVACATVSGGSSAVLHLPFWKIAASLPALNIRSFADFVQRTNLPMTIRKEWQTQAMQFWIPAFKLRPEIFLRTGRQITISQRQLGQERKLLAGSTLHPATLSLSEARQSLKIMVAASSTNNRSIFPHLPGVRPENVSATLVFLPFDDQQHDWVQSQTGTTIAKSVLQWGRSL